MFVSTGLGIVLKDVEGENLGIVLSSEGWQEFLQALDSVMDRTEGQLEITDKHFSGTITIEYTSAGSKDLVVIGVKDESYAIENVYARERTVILTLQEANQLWMQVSGS